MHAIGLMHGNRCSNGLMNMNRAKTATPNVYLDNLPIMFT